MTWGGGRDAPKEPCPTCGKLIDPRGHRDHRKARRKAAQTKTRKNMWTDPTERRDSPRAGWLM